MTAPKVYSPKLTAKRDSSMQSAIIASTASSGEPDTRRIAGLVERHFLSHRGAGAAKLGRNQPRWQPKRPIARAAALQLASFLLSTPTPSANALQVRLGP